MPLYEYKDEDEFYKYLENLFQNIIYDIKISKDTDIYEGNAFGFIISNINYILTFAKLKRTNYSEGKTFKFCRKLDENELEVIYQIQTNSSKAEYFLEKLKSIYNKNLALKKFKILNNFEKIEKKDNNVFIIYYSSSKYIMLYQEQILTNNEIQVTPKALFHDVNTEAVIKDINEVEYEALISTLNSYNDIFYNNSLQISEIELLNLLSNPDCADMTPQRIAELHPVSINESKPIQATITQSN